MRRRLVALLAALSVATPLVATGCTVRPLDDPVSPSPASPETAPPDLSGLVPDSVLATGVFTALDGGFTGRTEVVVDADGTAELRILDAASPLPQIAVSGSIDPLDDGVACFDARFRMYFTDWMPGEYSSRFGLAAFAGGDPTDLDEIVLTGPDDATTGCSAPIIARARLDWSIEPTFRIPAPADGGARPGATGSALVEDGTLVGYRVARGDVMQTISERFSIRIEDVAYLNPGRPRDPDTLYAQEVLNLDPDGR